MPECLNAGMPNAECRMRNAECGMRNAECGMRNAGPIFQNREKKPWNSYPGYFTFFWTSDIQLIKDMDIGHGFDKLQYQKIGSLRSIAVCVCMYIYLLYSVLQYVCVNIYIYIYIYMLYIVAKRRHTFTRSPRGHTFTERSEVTRSPRGHTFTERSEVTRSPRGHTFTERSEVTHSFTLYKQISRQHLDPWWYSLHING